MTASHGGCKSSRLLIAPGPLMWSMVPGLNTSAIPQLSLLRAGSCYVIWTAFRGREKHFCSLIALSPHRGDVGEGLDDIPWKLEDPGAPDQFRIIYRMIYTLLFFILVSTILMNIIFGVIIDTFAELRSKKDAIDRCVYFCLCMRACVIRRHG